MSKLDDHYIYVFVRQDIPLAQQVVDVSHVCYHTGSAYGLLDGIPSLIVVGLPHLASLNKVVRKLTEGSIQHISWHDPDLTYGVTAIATVPLSPQQKAVLSNYRLWTHSSGIAQAVCGVTADGGANAAVAQLREHSVSNGEVVGANPAGGSIS